MLWYSPEIVYGFRALRTICGADLRDTFRSIELGKDTEMRKEVSADSVVKDIRRRSRRKYSVEEKIGIVLEGLRGEDSIAYREAISARSMSSRNRSTPCSMV